MVLLGGATATENNEMGGFQVLLSVSPILLMSSWPSVD
jgi:hypothetical protein